jgi:hypothetical protein
MKRTAIGRDLRRKPPARPDRSAEFASVIVDRCRARMASDLGAEAPRPVPRETVHRSEAWRRAVAELPCVICGAHGTQAAHRNVGKGLAQKTDDALTASLCPTCHAGIDQGAAMTRDQRRAEMDRAIVLTVRELARAGRLMVE